MRGVHNGRNLEVTEAAERAHTKESHEETSGRGAPLGEDSSGNGRRADGRQVTFSTSRTGLPSSRLSPSFTAPPSPSPRPRGSRGSTRTGDPTAVGTPSEPTSSGTTPALTARRHSTRPRPPLSRPRLPNDRLRQAMHALDMRDHELAAAVQVDPKTVQRWMAGRTPHPRLRWAAAEVLGCEEHDLWPEVIASRLTGRGHAIYGVYSSRAAVPRELWLELITEATSRLCVLDDSALYLVEDVQLRGAIAQRIQAGVAVRVCLAEPAVAVREVRQVDELEPQQRAPGRRAPSPRVSNGHAEGQHATSHRITEQHAPGDFPSEQYVAEQPDAYRPTSSRHVHPQDAARAEPPVDPQAQLLAAQVHLSLQHWRQLHRHTPQRRPGVQLRLHASSPGLSLLIADRDMLVSHHLPGVPAASCPVLHLRLPPVGLDSTGSLGEVYDGVWEGVWAGAANSGG